MNKNSKLNLKILFLCIFITYSVGFIGSFFSAGNTDSEWYEGIRPEITPPGYVFPIVWNILFFMIALSLFILWKNSKYHKIKIKIILLFGINFLLNISWSLFYFGFKNPLAGFIILILLWLSIISLLIFSYRINKTSSYLLIPYFLWVSFAGILNYLSI